MAVALASSAGFFAYHYLQGPTDQTTVAEENTGSAAPTNILKEDSLNPDWFTYSNSEFGFELDHPTYWEVRDILPANQAIPAHSNKTLFLALAPEQIKYDFLGSISVTTDDLETVIDSHTTFPAGAPNQVLSQTKVEFAGQEATKIVTFNPVAEAEGTVYVFTKDELQFSITSAGTEDNTDIEAIIDTFRFVE